MGGRHGELGRGARCILDHFCIADLYCLAHALAICRIRAKLFRTWSDGTIVPSRTR